MPARMFRPIQKEVKKVRREHREMKRYINADDLVRKLMDEGCNEDYIYEIIYDYRTTVLKDIFAHFKYKIKCSIARVLMAMEKGYRYNKRFENWLFIVKTNSFEPIHRKAMKER